MQPESWIRKSKSSLQYIDVWVEISTDYLISALLIINFILGIICQLLISVFQAVIMPALCFLKIIGKKATRTQVFHVSLLTSTFRLFNKPFSSHKLFHGFAY